MIQTTKLKGIVELEQRGNASLIVNVEAIRAHHVPAASCPCLLVLLLLLVVVVVVVVVVVASTTWYGPATISNKQ
jgi:hypothetical protein